MSRAGHARFVLGQPPPDGDRVTVGGVSQADTRIPACAEAAAVKQADADPQVVQAGQDAEHARDDLAQIEALPIAEAAQLVGDRAAQAEMERIAAEQAKATAAARAAKLARYRPSSDHRRSGPERDFGPSL